MKKPPQKSNKFDREREFTVVLEGLRSEFQLFAEDLRSVKDKVGIIFETVGRHEEQLFIIRTDIRILKEDVKILKEDMKTVKTTLGSVDERVFRLEEISVK